MWKPLRTAGPAIWGVAGAFVVLGAALTVIAVLAGGRDAVPVGAIGANSGSTPEGAVAGNRMATPVVAPSAKPGDIGGGSPMTFDELIMGRALSPALDRLVRSGRAEVAAIPNAVDRSLRLVAVAGTPGTVCQDLSDRAPYRVVADVMAPAPNGQRMVLRRERRGDPIEAGLEIRDHGTLVVVPDGDVLGSIPAGEWLVVQLVLDQSGSILEVTARTTQGGGSASVQVPAAAGWVGAAETEFCFSSSATTGGEVYVNNLLIH
jgi:hypothetical protein